MKMKIERQTFRLPVRTTVYIKSERTKRSK